MNTDSTHGLRHGLAQGQVSRQSRGGPGRRYICVGNRQDYSLRRVERAGGWVARVRVGTPARLSCRKAAQSAELPRHRRVATRPSFRPSRHYQHRRQHAQPLQHSPPDSCTCSRSPSSAYQTRSRFTLPAPAVKPASMDVLYSPQHA